MPKEQKQGTKAHGMESARKTYCSGDMGFIRAMSSSLTKLSCCQCHRLFWGFPNIRGDGGSVVRWLLCPWCAVLARGRSPQGDALQPPITRARQQQPKAPGDASALLNPNLWGGV